MPKIYQYLTFVFSFYTREHKPIHVHVKKQERESKCDIEYQNGTLILTWKIVRGQKRLTETEMGIAEQLIKTKHLAIVDKWNQLFIFGKAVKCEKITKL